MLGSLVPAPRSGLHPLAALSLAVVFLSLGLAVRPLELMGFYLAGITALVLVLGYWRPWLGVLRFVLPAGAVVGLLTWLFTGERLSLVLVLERFYLFGVTTCLVAAMNPGDLSRALNRVRCPRHISLGFLITVRFIPVLKSEMDRIREAVRVRGLRLSWKRPGQAHRVLLLPLVVRLIHISDTLALSLETRAFSAPGRPTALRTPGLTWRDWVGLPLGLGLVAATAWRLLS